MHDWKLLLFLFFPFWGKLQCQFSGPSRQSPSYDANNSIGFHWNLSNGVVRGIDIFLLFLCFDFTWSYRSALLVTTAAECITKPLEVLAWYSLWITEGSILINAGCWLQIRITITVTVNQTLPIKTNFVSKMALKWLNRLSSLLQHLFDLTAIKTEMMIMIMLKVLMQCSSFYNMIHQNLHMYNNFIFAGWTVFNRKINIFEIINLQLSYLDKNVDQPANS